MTVQPVALTEEDARQPLPDFVAFLACTAVLVAAGLVAATLAGQALLGFLGWLAA